MGGRDGGGRWEGGTEGVGGREAGMHLSVSLSGRKGNVILTVCFRKLSL